MCFVTKEDHSKKPVEVRVRVNWFILVYYLVHVFQGSVDKNVASMKREYLRERKQQKPNVSF